MTGGRNQRREDRRQIAWGGSRDAKWTENVTVRGGRERTNGVKSWMEFHRRSFLSLRRTEKANGNLTQPDPSRQCDRRVVTTAAVLSLDLTGNQPCLMYRGRPPLAICFRKRTPCKRAGRIHWMPAMLSQCNPFLRN